MYLVNGNNTQATTITRLLETASQQMQEEEGEKVRKFPLQGGKRKLSLEKRSEN